MHTRTRYVVGVTLLLALAATLQVDAQDRTSGSLRLNATGRFARGGDFAGTFTINRFEQRGQAIVAIGFLHGTLSRGQRTLGTAIAGEAEWPVALRVGGISAASGPDGSARFIAPVRWSPASHPRVVPVQAESCPVVQVALGPVNIDLLGVDVALDPIALAVTGEAGTPLGDLVCAVSDLLGNVAGLVDVLNGILGLLTGLLGGLVGGLGGLAP